MILKQLLQSAQHLIDNNQLQEAITGLTQVANYCLDKVANTYVTLNLENEALETINGCCDRDPNNWMFETNRSHALNHFNHFEEAKQSAIRAIELSRGQQDKPYYNLGVFAGNLLQLKLAIAAYREALKLNPTDQKTIHNLSTMLLKDNQYKEGFELYEARLKAFPDQIEVEQRFTTPHWNGEDLTNKTILVYSTQGLGDLIMFARWLPYLKGNVILEAQHSLAELLQDNFPNIKVVARGNKPYPIPPKSDYIVAACSLAKFFNETIPFNSIQNYLKAKTKYFPETTKKRVGFCYAGNSNHSVDHWRSIPIQHFEQLSQLDNIELISFQQEPLPPRVWQGKTVDLKEGFEKVKAYDLSPFLDSLKTVAEYLNDLDLFITVDSSLAHLAGAMGIRTWLLAPYIGDWRWGIKGNKSEWYDSIRIFRQDKTRNWTTVLTQVEKELKEI